MIGTGTPLMNQLTHSFTPQLARTGDAHVDVQLRATCGSGTDPQSGGDVCYTLISGMSAELPRDSASESSTLVAPVDGSRATLDMQMTSDRDRELASLFPSPSMFDLTAVADGADARHHAVIQYRPYT